MTLLPSTHYVGAISRWPDGSKTYHQFSDDSVAYWAKSPTGSWVRRSYGLAGRDPLDVDPARVVWNV